MVSRDYQYPSLIGSTLIAEPNIILYIFTDIFQGHAFDSGFVAFTFNNGNLLRSIYSMRCGRRVLFTVFILMLSATGDVADISASEADLYLFSVMLFVRSKVGIYILPVHSVLLSALVYFATIHFQAIQGAALWLILLPSRSMETML